MDLDVQTQQLTPLPTGLHSLLCAPLNPQQSTALGFLDAYFCDKEINNLLRLAKANDNNCGWQRGFVPLETVANFKAVKKEKVSKDALRDIAGALPRAFELSPDGNSLRRLVSFTQQTTQQTIQQSHTLSNSCCLFTGIPRDAINLDLLAFLSEKLGAIARSDFPPAPFSATTKTCFIQFTNPQTMISILASSTSPATYEDAILSVEPATFPTTTTPTPLTFDFNHPSLTTRSARSIPLKLPGQISIQPAAVLGYPLNRVLRFGPIPSTTGFTASSIQSLARTQFESLAPVAECILKPGDAFGTVRFKKSVAKEIAEMLMRHDGIELSGEKVKVEALGGEQERLFHDVKREKEKAVAAAAKAVVSEAMIAVNAVKAVKARRSLEQKKGGGTVAAVVQRNASEKRRHSSRIAAKVAATAAAEAKKNPSVAAKVNKKGKKRVIVDEDMAEAGSNEKGSRAILGTRHQKKAKVDDLEDLVKGMTAFN
ncbi:hypothetical protein HDU98_000756 [Podochytrium sp. JEL0797]|nr:hypothetical protein HDU98_000756 [Podochytrium sp. JEL0797]